MQFIFIIMAIYWLCADINAAPELLLKEQISPEKLKVLAIDKAVQPKKLDFGDDIIIGKKYENQIHLTSMENQREKGKPRLYPLFPDFNSEDHIFYPSGENDQFLNNPMPMYMPQFRSLQNKNFNVKIAARGK